MSKSKHVYIKEQGAAHPRRTPYRSLARWVLESGAVLGMVPAWPGGVVSVEAWLLPDGSAVEAFLAFDDEIEARERVLAELLSRLPNAKPPADA